VKGTPESGKFRLVGSRKIAKEKMKIAMLCESSYDPLIRGSGGECCISECLICHPLKDR
jgi:hypothetical protein